MKQNAPPSLLNALLRLLLPERDRETVSGDLYEEFMEAKVPEHGRFKARVWYLRQVISFLPAKATAILLRGRVLGFLCIGTGSAGAWLGMMDLRMRHPGYQEQLVIAATIVVQALLTVGALRFPRYGILRAVAAIGSLGLLWLAGLALKATLYGAHVEGYILLIALALIVQAVLTTLTMPKTRTAEVKGT